jgi:hypothetical protein
MSVVVTVLAGRNLVAKKKNGTSDPFVVPYTTASGCRCVLGFEAVVFGRFNGVGRGCGKAQDACVARGSSAMLLTHIGRWCRCSV